MIVSCPVCESRFNIDPDRISPRGRQVRCGKCGHVWRSAADGSAMAVAAGSPHPSEPETSNDVPAVDNPPNDGGLAMTAELIAPVLEQEPSDHAAPQPVAPAADADSATTSPDSPEEDKVADTVISGDPMPPLLGAGMSPNARQRLAEARKGRSRTRFLLIALILMIVVAVAVSFIKQPDTFNDALRLVPGLDKSNSD